MVAISFTLVTFTKIASIVNLEKRIGIDTHVKFVIVLTSGLHTIVWTDVL